MEREVEFLRLQVQYLERMLETCMGYLSSLEARVAELERRPVAVQPPEEVSKHVGSLRSHKEPVELLESSEMLFLQDWSNPRSRRR